MEMLKNVDIMEYLELCYEFVGGRGFISSSDSSVSVNNYLSINKSYRTISGRHLWIDEHAYILIVDQSGYVWNSWVNDDGGVQKVLHKKNNFFD